MTQEGNKAATCLYMSHDGQIMFARSFNIGEARDFHQIYQ